jgi:hypothetical protein
MAEKQIERAGTARISFLFAPQQYVSASMEIPQLCCEFEMRDLNLRRRASGGGATVILAVSIISPYTTDRTMIVNCPTEFATTSPVAETWPIIDLPGKSPSSGE